MPSRTTEPTRDPAKTNLDHRANELNAETSSLELDHPALICDREVHDRSFSELSQADLSERERLAVVLQLLGLFAVLNKVELELPEKALIAVDGRGLLAVDPGSAGLVAAARSKTCQMLDLVGELFHQEWEQGEAPHVSGRGAVRRLLNDWLQIWLGPMDSFDIGSAAENLLDRADFLWQPAFADARRHLVGAIEGEVVVALPCHRLSAMFGDDRASFDLALNEAEAMRAWLARPHAGKLWCAIDFEARSRASRAQGSIEALYACGAFDRVVDELKDDEDRHCRLRVAQSLYHLHQLRSSWSRVEELASEVFESGVVDADALELADLALRLTANLELKDAQARWRRWLARASDEAPKALKWQARLLHAWSDWDCRDIDSMATRLDSIPEQALHFGVEDSSFRLSSYFQARSLLAAARGEGESAVANLTKALSPAGRRRLKRFEAGRLWNDMAVARCQTQDLPGAERACRHAVRLLASCDGPGATTLALRNLAEVRIRRGRLSGVESVIRSSAATNRQAGNERGEVEDLALWMRFDLARGEVGQALDRWRELSLPGWDDEEILALALRALVWSGRQAEALQLLPKSDPRQSHTDSALLQGQLENEEVVVVWLLVGRPDLANCALSQLGARDRCWADLLASLAALGRQGSGSLAVDRELERSLYAELEPYAAARHLYDLDLLGVLLEPDTRARAARVFDRAGAPGLARRMGRGGEHTWQVWSRFQKTPDLTIDGLRRFFQEAGYGHVQVYGDGGGGAGAFSEAAAHRFVRRLELTSVKGATDRGVCITASRGDTGLAVLVDSLQMLVDSCSSGGSRGRSTLLGSSSMVPSPTSARGGLIGTSVTFSEAVNKLERVGRQKNNVLIQGETGTGKELAARLLHDSSARARRDFLAVNCAALGEQNLLLAELFGHARGAFTGAEKDRAGVFEAAHGGTVFLDEIGDLPYAAQGMLLRVLQEGEVRRLGETRSRSIDVRVVAATHRDLRALSQEGDFRLDLYFRLAVATVELPPLRERSGDVLILAREFLGRVAPQLSWSAEAVELLCAHPWPGNVRELRHVVEVAAATCLELGSISVEACHLELHGTSRPAKESAASIAASRGGYQQRVEDFKRALVRDALEQHDGNQAAAARSLGMRRQSLWHLARKFDLV